MASSKTRRKTKAKTKTKSDKADDFLSVARRLGANESRERFEATLKKIAKAKPK
jgi:hypothetical protein